MFTIFEKKTEDEKGRDFYFDNAKFIIILLVVIAHIISPIKTHMPFVKAVWTLINAFHMPCLIMISGYFAKSYFLKDGGVKKQRLFTYVIYYLAAQIAVSLFEYFVLDNTSMAISVFGARSSLWYLVCLCVWYAILPYIVDVKPQILLPVSVLCGLLVGYDTLMGSGFMSMGRVVNHFPFFLIGFYFKKEWLFKFRNIYTQIGAAGILAVSFLWIWKNLDKIAPRIIISSYDYAHSNLIYFTEHFQWMNRFLYYIVACVLCACVMLLIPRYHYFFTHLGSRTLQVYILHRFIYLAELTFLWYEPFTSRKGFCELVLIATVMTFVLSLKIFEYPFKALAMIKLSWFEKKDNNGW